MNTVAPWIFLRGLVRESRHWGAFVGEFVAEFERTGQSVQVVTLDLAGNGLRHTERSPHTVGAMVEDCRAQLRARGLSGPYKLLAVSMGAMVAAEWSRIYPNEVLRQVLINTSMRPFSSFYQRLRPENYGRIVWLLRARAPAQRWEQAILCMTANRPHPEVLTDWTQLRETCPVSITNTLLQLWAALRYRASATSPHPATLVLGSPCDRLVSVACSMALAQVWGVPLGLHPDAGHDMTLDAGPWVAHAVRHWCDTTADPLRHSTAM